MEGPARPRQSVRVSDDRLLRAVTDAVEPLAQLGFEVRSAESSHRGSRVDLGNAASLVAIVADWLEGELQITVNTGGGPVDVGLILDLAKVEGLHLRRLSRGISTDSLTSQLRRHFEILATDAHEYLRPKA